MLSLLPAFCNFFFFLSPFDSLEYSVFLSL